MSRNLPLDANDEDLIQRGLRRPSLDESLLPISDTFQAVRSSYDNATTGIASIDNIWPVRSAEELSSLTDVERRQYLEQRGLVPPEGSLPSDISLPGIDKIVETAAQVDNEVINAVLAKTGNVTEQITNLNQRLDSAISQGANIPTDSYGQSLLGPTTSPAPLTAPSPIPSTNSGQVGTSGGTGSAYTYTPIDLYDDRYDFNTGQVIRKGVATGTKGGIGVDDRPGNTVPSTGVSDLQSETPIVPPNLTPNDTTPEQYDDAILRQARGQEYSSPTVNNETTAEVAQQEDQTIDYSDGTGADTGNWTPPGTPSNRLDSKGATPSTLAGNPSSRLDKAGETPSTTTTAATATTQSSSSTYDPTNDPFFSSISDDDTIVGSKIDSDNTFIPKRNPPPLPKRNPPPPPRKETSPPQLRDGLAPKAERVASRKQTTLDIHRARARGVTLVRKRRPDGTNYAAPAS